MSRRCRATFSHTVKRAPAQVLKDHPEPQIARHQRRGHRDHLAVERDLAAVGLVHAVEHLHQRALAGAVLAEKRMDLAGAHAELDGVVGPQRPEDLGQPAYREQWWRAKRSGPARLDDGGPRGVAHGEAQRPGVFVTGAPLLDEWEVTVDIAVYSDVDGPARPCTAAADICAPAARPPVQVGGASARDGGRSRGRTGESRPGRRRVASPEGRGLSSGGVAQQPSARDVGVDPEGADGAAEPRTDAGNRRARARPTSKTYARATARLRGLPVDPRW